MLKPRGTWRSVASALLPGTCSLDAKPHLSRFASAALGKITKSGMKDRRFVNNLEVVTCVHFLCVAALALLPAISKWMPRKQQMIIPIEFTVEAPPDALDRVLREIEEDKDRIPDFTAQPKPKPKPKPEPQKKPEPAPKKIERPAQTARKPTLTQEEIRKWLAKGARLSDHTSIPPEDARCMELVRRALYDAWNQPSYDEVGNATALVVIRFERDGSVFGARLAKKSGSELMDSSVMQAATSVRKIEGLTRQFLDRFDEVTIEFKVEPGG
mgnify:CR=1 FL=1